MNPVKINEIARKPDGEMSRKVNCRRQGVINISKVSDTKDESTPSQRKRILY